MHEALNGISHLLVQHGTYTHVLIEFETHDGRAAQIQPQQYIAQQLYNTPAIVYRYEDGQVLFALFAIDEIGDRNFDRVKQRHKLCLDQAGIQKCEKHFDGLELVRWDRRS